MRRILKPGGVIALWLYDHCRINEELDVLSREYSEKTVVEYWPIENRKAWNFEESVDFPFERIKTPEFLLKVNWSLDEYLKYLYTWSSTQNYISKTGKDPIKVIYNRFRKLWKNENEINHEKLMDEMGDVFYSLLLLADKYSIHLEDALINKLEKNKIKYPISEFKDSNKKYDE